MSAVQDVLVWWAAQMLGLVPARLRTGDAYGDALIADIVPPSAGFSLVQRRNRQEMPLDSKQAAAWLARRPPPRVVLRVPAAAVLERRLVLPLVAEPELDRVVAYEIDRISPFAASEVAWTHAVERRDKAAGRLHVRLAMLPRAGLDAAVGALRATGAAPRAALAPRAGSGAWVIDLSQRDASPAGQPFREAWRRRAFAMASVACAVLAVTAAALPFLVQEAALRREGARIAQLRPTVASADALRQRIATRASGLDTVASEAARVGQALNVLATLTALLPDDTYLTALTLRQRALTLSGRSASASRLIPLLAADPALQGAAFAAPVTRVEGARGDVFSLRAEFRS